MPTTTDMALWAIMPDLMAEDAFFRPAVERYLAAAGAPLELLNPERFKTEIRLFEFYRHFCRVHLSFTAHELKTGDQTNEVNYNSQMLLAKPYWRVRPKFPNTTEYWFHFFTGLIASKSTINQYGDPDRFLDALELQRARFNPSFDPPRLLFRGQRRRYKYVVSPMARALLNANTEGFRISVLGWDSGLTEAFSHSHALAHHPPYWEEVAGLLVPMDMGQILARFTLHVSMNMRVGLYGFGASSANLPGEPVLMTPFHLALFQGRHSIEEAAGMAWEAGIKILSQSLLNLPDGFVKDYVAHLTDYELPVPIVGSSGIVRDFVPNPFVSTTTDLRTALLYASGYFNSFSDKLNVDWGDVYDRCRSEQNTGVVYAFRVNRPVLPVTREAGAETIGAVEAEYAVPGAIASEEIVSVIPVKDLIKRIDLVSLESYLNSQGLKDPDGEVQWRFVEGNQPCSS
jgi:hypothetical protein